MKVIFTFFTAIAISLLLLTAYSVHAEPVTFSWVSPAGPHGRADESELLPDEIAGYHLKYGLAPDQYTTTIHIDDGAATTKTIDLSPGTYSAVMTTIDTGGRESVPSTVITKTVLAGEIKTPNRINNLTISHSSSNNYEFKFTPPDKYTNGSEIPAGAITKYFLFDNGAWIRDVPVAETSFTRELSTGIHSFEMEVETYNSIVSSRSVPVIVNVLDNPKPPSEFKFNIPEGFKATVEIVPYNN